MKIYNHGGNKMKEFYIKNLRGEVKEASHIRALAIKLYENRGFQTVFNKEHKFICVVNNKKIKVASPLHGDIVRQIRNALFDEHVSTLYSNMCSGCEREHYCHNGCDNCEEYAEAFEKLEIKFYGGN